MLSGSVKVSWKKNDFVGLNYRTYTTPVENFKPLVSITDHKNINVFTCSENIPDSLMTVLDNFDLDKKIIAINKMVPGQILPYHIDLYKSYIKNNSIIDVEKIIRIIVFLEDTKPGHQLWIDDTICIGKAGDYFGWTNDTKHMAANLGFDDRYVIQITGVKL